MLQAIGVIPNGGRVTFEACTASALVLRATELGLRAFQYTGLYGATRVVRVGRRWVMVGA